MLAAVGPRRRPERSGQRQERRGERADRAPQQQRVSRRKRPAPFQSSRLSAERQSCQRRVDDECDEPDADCAEELNRQRNLGDEERLGRWPAIGRRGERHDKHDCGRCQEQPWRVAPAAPGNHSCDGRRDEQPAKDNADDDPNDQVAGTGRALLTFPLLGDEDEPAHGGHLVAGNLHRDSGLALRQRWQRGIDKSERPVGSRLALGWTRRHLSQRPARHVEAEVPRHDRDGALARGVLVERCARPGFRERVLDAKDLAGLRHEDPPLFGALCHVALECHDPDVPSRVPASTCRAADAVSLRPPSRIRTRAGRRFRRRAPAARATAARASRRERRARRARCLPRRFD